MVTGVQTCALPISGKANVFTEHDAEGELLGSFRYDSSNMGYRVYKDAFDGFWFVGG